VRAAGWSVAVIDHLPFGGTCALRGCDPKKMLITGAEAIDNAPGRRRRARHQLAGDIPTDLFTTGASGGGGMRSAIIAIVGMSLQLRLCHKPPPKPRAY
jgi:hypothetical protein